MNTYDGASVAGSVSDSSAPEPQVPAGQIQQPAEAIAATAATERNPIDQVIAVASRARATALEAATQAREAVSVQKVDLPFGLPEVPVPTVDLAKFDASKLDLPKIDLAKIDFAKFDPSSIDVPALAADARERLAAAGEDVRRGVTSTVTLIREAVRL
ncbi:MAG: hypothetical protein ACKN9D_07095 [Actinomycetales bacterium]